MLIACLRKILKFVVKLGCISGCTKIGLLGFGVCRRLFRRTTFKAFLCGLFVDIGQVACHAAQPIYARGAGFASQQGPNAVESPFRVGAEVA